MENTLSKAVIAKAVIAKAVNATARSPFDSIIAKALTLVFTAIFLAACASTDTTTDDTDTGADTGTETTVDTSERDRLEAQRLAEERRIRDLEAAASAAGKVFYFDFDSSTLRSDVQDALDAHIALLKTNNSSVRLEGHTDERGTRDYNLALGERRANSVRDYMVVNGIASYRIETVSFGEEQPNAYGSGEANWSRNRRVELVP
ncbi:MAG: peptidoglycan-associated lipoprotein Pal [Pseudomonadota bacterium]